MLDRLLKPILPRSLMGRAALILIVPVTGILILVSAAVIQRHYDRVTRQMTAEFSLTANHLREVARTGGDLGELATAFRLQAEVAPTPADASPNGLPLWELSARLARRELLLAFPDLVGLTVGPYTVDLALPLEPGGGEALHLRFPLSRLTASNPHQLLVLSVAAALLMTLIAFIFLRNQLRPIRRLARAAEAFGRGQSMPLRVSGSTEVRAASQAFLDMRARIEAQIEQRTLMLSGVSHDLRTPLTRARLALSLMEGEPEAEALGADLAQMEALIDRYLDFVRDGAAESETLVDLPALVAEQVAWAVRSGAAVSLRPVEGPAPMVRLRPALFGRALNNLIGNALRYGGQAELWIERVPGGIAVCIEDSGPGIPAERREEALRPFARLDGGRRADGGVGLGLAIVADAIRSHGGRVELEEGTTPGLGGLLVRLVLPAERAR